MLSAAYSRVEAPDLVLAPLKKKSERKKTKTSLYLNFYVLVYIKTFHIQVMIHLTLPFVILIFVLQTS